MKRLASAALPALVLGLTLAAFVPSAAASSPFGFRIYDPARQVHTEVTSADVIRSSVRVALEPGGRASLSLAFTNAGASKFHLLTRALARRGLRLHRHQAFAVEIGGRVRSRPWIDYKLFPNGLDGSSGIEIQGVPVAVAQQLSKLIRGG